MGGYCTKGCARIRIRPDSPIRNLQSLRRAWVTRTGPRVSEMEEKEPRDGCMECARNNVACMGSDTGVRVRTDVPSVVCNTVC